MSTNISVAFNTYPMAFDVPGGGEQQLLAYFQNLPYFSVHPKRFDLWNPCLKQVNLVHFFSVFGGSLPFCSYIKHDCRLPLVVSSSLWITKETKDRYPVEEIYQILSCADTVVTNGITESEQLASVLGLPREKFFTVYNGIDEKFTTPEDPDLFRQHAKGLSSYILSVGNIEPRKNQLALIKAIKHFPEYKLLLIGRARDKRYAEQCFAEGGEQLVFHGVVPHESPLLRSSMAAATLFAMPSLLETPSLAALEAAAQGARIVITEVGSTREYFGDMADYADPYSVDSIVRALENALNRPADGRLAAHVSTNFTWRAVLPKLVDIYTSLIK